MKRFRLTFTDGNDHRKVRDVSADNSEDAMKMGYRMPEAKSGLYTDIWCEEIKEGPKTIGVRFIYSDEKGRAAGSQYMFIYANDEAQAKEYFIRHFKGKHFYQPWPTKIDENGNCTYEAVAETYFAGGNGYDFDATKEGA